MKKAKVACTALLVGLLAAGPAMASIAVSIEPVAQVVDIGDPLITVDIVADIPVDDAIVQWGVDLSYNASVIELFGGSWATAVSINETLFDAAYAPDGDELCALVPAEDVNVSGNDILLATVSFVPVGLGLSNVCPSDSNPLSWNGSFWEGTGDLTEGFLKDPPPVGAYIPADYTCGTIEVTPEPTTLALLAFGGLAVIRRRR
ncbi:MAG: PEP-CTERM sorting domain-containing protein [Phycisphaerae bacterium]|nr:PEP-CTERM sorting domain-containing protein [Phycisphaerae bacterium]